MKNIVISLSYYDVVHMMQADARNLADGAGALSHADIMEYAEKMKRYPALLTEAWGTGFGRE